MSAGNMEGRRAFAKGASQMAGRGNKPLVWAAMWFSDVKMFATAPKKKGAPNDRILTPNVVGK